MGEARSTIPLTPPPLRSADLSPSGEEDVGSNTLPLLPDGEKVAAKQPDEGRCQAGNRHRTRSVALASQTDFAGWRAAARTLALNEVKPSDIVWHVEGAEGESDLFACSEPSLPPPLTPPHNGEG